MMIRKFKASFQFIAAFQLLSYFSLFLILGSAGCNNEDTFKGFKPRKYKNTRGICVVLGDKTCESAIMLAKQTGFLIYLQVENIDDLNSSSRSADKAGLYGKRIFIGKGNLSKISMADNIADILIAINGTTSVSKSEALRVLHPGGKAFIGKKVFTKPVPAGIDDWSHPYHGPDNNPQTKDKIAKAPYLTHFLAAPFYSPLPQVTVSSGGRVFRALGHIAFKEREEKWCNKLVAYNGYNGTVLWKRDITPGLMVHRNTLIATPDNVYHGDNKSCKVIDATTGELKDEIIPPVDLAGGTFWKWMALDNNVLYALIGKDEMIDPEVRRSNPDHHGWPWYPLSKGYNLKNNPWGFGRNLLAINTKTKEIIWHYSEKEPIDSRALCMKNGLIFAFNPGVFLTCVDATTGSVVWRKTPAKDPGLFKALGRRLNRQDWRTNWRTTAYLKCSDKALYFSGPTMAELIALSTRDGSVLWRNQYNNYQLVLRKDGLYCISGPWGNAPSKRLDPLTGKILNEFNISRRACTRPTGSIDAVFFRANGGTVRMDESTFHPQYISPMRPNCHDGVTIANGLLYWWPSVCDCQLTLYGITCLGPAGDFNFNQKATETQRLETGHIKPGEIATLSASDADWPTFRANNKRTATSPAQIPSKCKELWHTSPKIFFTPTPPVTAGGFVFLAGSDGIIRSYNISNGRLKWKAYTGGTIRIAPTIWKNMLFAGSGDGWVYALEAATGRLVWRFRAAPRERRIPVYGRIMSTWPASSGVIVKDGTAYVAAGISNFDETYVYALDAETGSIRWQNNSSGHLNREAHCGVGVQGHLLLNNGKLYMAGGNAVSPAIYDIRNGKCLNSGKQLNICESICLRGWELFLIGDKVAVGGQPFYGDPDYPVVDTTVYTKLFSAPGEKTDIIWLNNTEVLCYPPIDRQQLTRCVYNRTYPGHHIIKPWGKFSIPDKPLWQKTYKGGIAIARCKNAVVIAQTDKIIALDIQDGNVTWSQPLSEPPVQWGLAVNKEGLIIVTLKNGETACFGNIFINKS